MPIVVNELLIKVSITDEDQGVGTGSGNSGSEDSEVSGSDALINACVEKVLEIIRENEER